jgi:hypothetical protein
VRGQAGNQTGQESRSAGRRAAGSVIVMGFADHPTFRPDTDPDAALTF